MAPVTVKFSVVHGSYTHSESTPQVGPKQMFMSIELEYTGKDMQGKGVEASVMTFHAGGDGSFEGSRTFEGTLLGKKGSFAMSVVGEFAGKRAAAKYEILPKTATGELAGITGSGGYGWPEADKAVESELVVEMP